MPLHIEESKGSHHIPGTQLSLVLILAIAVAVQGFSTVKFIAYGPGPLLGEPGLARIVKQPGIMQAGLVPMIIEHINT